MVTEYSQFNQQSMLDEITCHPKPCGGVDLDKDADTTAHSHDAQLAYLSM